MGEATTVVQSMTNCKLMQFIHSIDMLHSRIDRLNVVMKKAMVPPDFTHKNLWFFRKASRMLDSDILDISFSFTKQTRLQLK